MTSTKHPPVSNASVGINYDKGWMEGDVRKGKVVYIRDGGDGRTVEGNVAERRVV